MRVWPLAMATALRELASVVEAPYVGEAYPTPTQFATGYALRHGWRREDDTVRAIEQVVRLVYALCDLDFWS
jgi:hypothetical protein